MAWESEWTLPSAAVITEVNRGTMKRIELGKVKQQIYIAKLDLQQWNEYIAIPCQISKDDCGYQK